MCLLMKLLDVENVAESHAIGELHNFQPATNDASLLHLVAENENFILDFTIVMLYNFICSLYVKHFISLQIKSI